MNKVEFIKELNIKLKNLPNEERNDAINYYSEYFEDAGMDDFADVEKEFGSPSAVASQILADYAVKEIKIKDKPVKKEISSIWFIILAIFASPIALPLAFAMVMVVASLAFALGTVIFAFGIAAGAIVFAGGMVFMAGVLVVISDFATALLFMGTGITLAGFGILLFVLVSILGKVTFKFMATLGNQLLTKINKNNK